MYKKVLALVCICLTLGLGDAFAIYCEYDGSTQESYNRWSQDSASVTSSTIVHYDLYVIRMSGTIKSECRENAVIKGVNENYNGSITGSFTSGASTIWVYSYIYAYSTGFASANAWW